MVRLPNLTQRPHLEPRRKYVCLGGGFDISPPKELESISTNVVGLGIQASA